MTNIKLRLALAFVFAVGSIAYMGMSAVSFFVAPTPVAASTLTRRKAALYYGD